MFLELSCGFNPVSASWVLLESQFMERSVAVTGHFETFATDHDL